MAEAEMLERKKIFYHYVAEPTVHDVRDDRRGDVAVPHEGAIIVHNGKWWCVIRRETEVLAGVAIYRLYLKNSVGSGRT